MGAVSAAAALALAPDLSRVGRVVSSLAPWRMSGFTRADSRDPVHRTLPSLTEQVPDSLQGKFCRFPVTTDSGNGHTGDSTVLGPLSDSSDLALEGQSQIVKADTAAICTGTTVPPLR